MDARAEIPDIAGLQERFEDSHRRDSFYIDFLKSVLTARPGLMREIKGDRIKSIRKGREGRFEPLKGNVQVSSRGTSCVVFDAYYADGTGSILVVEVENRARKTGKKKTG